MIAIENKALKADRTNKSTTLERWTAAVCSLRNKMRTQITETKEVKKQNLQKQRTATKTQTVKK